MSRRVSRRLVLESLESRLCLSGPTPYPGAPLELPQTGAWTQTQFISSPIWADLAGDGHQELITAAAGGELIAFAAHPDGSLYVYQTYQATTLPNGTIADIMSTPIVVTMPNGRTALFAAMGRNEYAPGTLEDGRVFGWDAITGQLLPGWPQSSGTNPEGNSGVIGSLAAADLNGDGKTEIVVGGFGHQVSAFNLDGTLDWRFTTDDTIESAPVIADIDGDGKPEVVIGSDSSQSTFYQNGGWVNILSNTGTLLYRYFHPNEVIWSSPILADTSGNGTLNIFVGTGLNYQIHGLPGAIPAGNQLLGISPQGQTLPGWPYATSTSTTALHETYASPVAADLLGNGQIDIIAVDRAGYLHVVQPNGQPLPGWAGGIPIAPDLPSAGDNYASPIVADVLGNGTQDIIVSAGPYLRAFSPTGQMVWSVIAPGATPDARFNAAAVGQFNPGGPYILASVTNNAASALDRPNYVMLYQIPNGAAPPQWPMLRRDATGDAVMNSPVAIQNFLNGAYNLLLNRPPDAGGLQTFSNLLQNNTLNYFNVAGIIANSTEARVHEINNLYERFLNRAPQPAEVANWLGLLANSTYRDAASIFMTAPEFQARGGSPGGVITLYYNVILGRDPSPAELNGWLSSGLPLNTIALDFLNSDEALGNIANLYYSVAFGANSTPAPDSLAAIKVALRNNVPGRQVWALVLGSGGNYAATDPNSSYVRSVYRDVLGRNAAPGEVAYWVNQLATGQINFNSLVAALLNSPEGRDFAVNQIFEQYLGRPASPTELQAFQNYQSREAVVAAVVNSDEFYNDHGGTPTGFVNAAFEALDQYIPPLPASVTAAWISQITAGAPRSSLTSALLAQGPEGLTYYDALAASMLFEYLPDESQGVLATGVLPPNAPGQPINPNPGEVAYFGQLLDNGATDESVIVTLLASPLYESTRVGYFMGIWRARGIRS